MSVNHHLLAKITTDNILKNFKSEDWASVGGSGAEFYRTGCNSNFPSPDAAFRDDTNKITVSFEFKPPTENKRGILTGVGQSIAYLGFSNVSYLVIPEFLEDFKIGEYISDLFTEQIVNKIPVGLISYKNDEPENVTLLHNVSLVSDIPECKTRTVNKRFWAKHQDLPVPLFHLLLHCYYLKRTRQISGDAFTYCWDKYIFPEESLKILKPSTIRDLSGDEIYTLGGSKKILQGEKRINAIVKLNASKRADEISRLRRDRDSSVIGDNMYNAVRKNYVTFLKHIEVIDSEGNITDEGFKLYHIGLVNGPNSKVFKDYFTKTILLTGHHLDLIFDLDKISTEYKGKYTYSEIKNILLQEYEDKGMIKRNPKRKAGKKNTVGFLKYEEILWNALKLRFKSVGKPEFNFNWEKITGICSLPEY